MRLVNEIVFLFSSLGAVTNLDGERFSHVNSILCIIELESTTAATANAMQEK